MFKNYKQNLHTHSIYCDGINTPEEMVLAAIEKGFQSIGFSSHGFLRGLPQPADKIEDYKKEIAELKDKYAVDIEIFCGLECEMTGNKDLDGFDYLIGSVHYFHFEDGMFCFDRNLYDTQKMIAKYFAGDGMAYAKAYYQEVAKLPQYGKYDIVGHFDVITKHCENVSLFDHCAKEYRNAAIEAVEQLAGKIPYFEVNAGSMPNGYRKSPFPDKFLIKEFKRLGFGAVVSTDCHDKNYMDCGYQESVNLLKECGFKERFILTKSGFESIPL